VHPTDDAYFGLGGTNGLYCIDIVGDTLYGIVFDEDLKPVVEQTLTLRA
jgi:hypothetical protein